jgi:putative ABC transport system permease protein
MAPYIYVDERFIAATGLLARGSRVQYEVLFALPEGNSAEAWKDEHWSESLDAHVTIRTSREAAGSVRRFLSRLSTFMTVVSLVTLFLGALGIASAMRAFMASKLDHAAVLRCVGATSRDLVLVFSLVSLGVGLGGSLLGAGLGTLAPLLLERASATLASGFLPAELVLAPSPSAILHGLAAGVLSTFAFTLVPVWRTSQVAPLRVLGRASDALRPLGAARLTSVAGIGAALLCVFVLAIAETESFGVGAVFTLAIALALLVLFGLARLIAALAGRTGPRLRAFHLRQGIANLHRPGNQTSAVIV